MIWFNTKTICTTMDEWFWEKKIKHFTKWIWVKLRQVTRKSIFQFYLINKVSTSVGWLVEAATVRLSFKFIFYVRCYRRNHTGFVSLLSCFSCDELLLMLEIIFPNYFLFEAKIECALVETFIFSGLNVDYVTLFFN